MVNLRDLAEGSLKKLSKKTLSKIQLKIINSGKEAAISFTCNLIKAKTGINQEICIKVATIIVNKLIKAIKEKARTPR